MVASQSVGSGDGTVEVTTRRPGAPREAAFALEIDFQKGTDNPQRVFQAADAMVRAFQALDRALCAAVDSRIEPVMLLEDIEAGSIKAWLSSQLNRIDDEAIKVLDWRPLVGKYLVRAKYAVIRWSNKEGGEGGIVGLAREIRAIAMETDIKHIPDYAPPGVQELSESVKRIDDAKNLLLPSDKISFVAPGEEPIDFNLAVRWTPGELSDLAVRETTKFPNMPMTLIVKRPDYLGKSKWDFRFGKKPISASVDDEEWLANFQARKVDVRPGDALRCLVSIEHQYGFDNELLSESYTISKVEQVLENQVTQGTLDIGKMGD